MPEANPLGDAIVKAAKDSFDHRGRGKIVVPEWQVDGQPVTIWFRPMTMAETFEIANYRPGDGEHFKMIRAIILKAEDADGKRLFTYDHELALRDSVEAPVLIRIAQAISSGPTVEQAEKN